MDISSFISSTAPMSVLGGGAFAMVSQGFKWVWRLAQVEQQSRENKDEIVRVESEAKQRHDDLVDALAPLPRIEVHVQQLIDDRRSGTDRRQA